MSNSNTISISELAELIEYDPDSGRLTWRVRTYPKHGSLKSVKVFNSRFAGKNAFTADNGGGYKQGRIYRKAYFAHRVAWAIANGHWPDLKVDHINGDRSDNRLANLRAVTNIENARNCSPKSKSSSGVKGVSLHKATGRWRAHIRSNHIGLFDRIEDAIEARKIASAKLGFSERHG